MPFVRCVGQSHAKAVWKAPSQLLLNNDQARVNHTERVLRVDVRDLDRAQLEDPRRVRLELDRNRRRRRLVEDANVDRRVQAVDRVLRLVVLVDAQLQVPPLPREVVDRERDRKDRVDDDVRRDCASAAAHRRW